MKKNRNYRLMSVVAVGLMFLILVALSNGFDAYGVWHYEKVFNPSGWVFKQLNNITEICIGLSALYFGHRIINHFRTHELIKKVGKIEDVRSVAVMITWIIAIAYVIGNALN